MITNQFREHWEILKESEVFDWDLMQYTGRVDKNGREIYEGDILKYSQDIYLVVWKDSAFRAVWKTNTHILHEPMNDFTIIGNLYENKKLWEGGENDAITKR